MQRFIRYLYEYDQARKLRNVGFVKVEQEDEMCTVHIHGKGFRMKGEQRLEVSLFYLEGEECIGIWQGTVENMNPAINYQLRYTREDTGIPENFERIDGIILEDADGRRYAAVWDEQQVNPGRMRFFEPVLPQPEELVPITLENTPEEITDLGNIENVQLEEKAEPSQQPLHDAVSEDTKIQETDCTYKCIKMQRQDLAKLPRCEWKYANNRFLLHGYYNYHHIVLIDDGNETKLGVPGIYHPQEARAAEAFGFPEFIEAEKVEIDRSREEEYPEERFGYWCRNVRGMCQRTTNVDSE